MLRRMLAMVLSIVMLLSLVPVQAFALDDAVVEPAVEVALPDEELIAETDPVETVPVETVAAETVPAETVEIPDTAEPTVVLTVEVQSDFVNTVQPRSASGTCGTNVSWYLDDAGTLTISGTGSMKDYSESSAAPWFAERLNIKQVVIKDGVTDIGNYAFYYCVNLQSMSIAGTVTSVGTCAFEYCTALKGITIPAGVKELYNYAFYGCSALESVSLPDTLTRIGYYCFQQCTALEGIEIPDSVNYIGSDAFRDCTALKSMELPDSITSLNSCLFHSCPNLESVKIPSGVTSIGYGAFNGCASLKEIQIPAKVTSIGGSAFCGCTSLTEVVLPDKLSYISSGCFDGCTGLTEIVIPRGVARIESSAFRDCVNLTSVSLSSGLVTIGEYAFYGCGSIASITIGANVKTIGNYGFYSCTKLAEVVLPDGIETLGERAFAQCNNLESINLPASLKSVGRYCFSAEKEVGGKLQLIDLSSNPAKMAAQEMQLKYSLPKVLVDATGKKNEIYWSFVYTWEDQQAGKPNPWDIAHIDHEGTLYSNGNSIGTVTVLCCDEYTGATGTWEIEISSGVVIRTDREEDYLVSGDAMQLSAWIMPGNIKTNVNWSIREQDKEFAAINSTGKLTARAVNGAKQIEVTATPYVGGESATLKVWIVPRTTGLYIYEGMGDVTGLELDIDSFVYPSVQLDAVTYPEGAMTDVYWTTSDENVASVDNGLVTFNGLDTVTISVIAGDGSGKSASVTLNVSFRESARKLVAIVDAEDNTLRSGETAQIWIYGSDEDVLMDPSLFEFGVPGSQTAVATVDDGGLITAGEMAGTATITASMRGDPLGRRVSIMITVKARQTEKLLLHALADEKAQVQMLDGNGNVTSDVKNAVSYSVLMKKADVENEAYSFVVRPEAFHSAGSFHPEMTGLKWASSNTNVATVVVQRDGTAIVTVKQGASGACVISAVTNDESKIENSSILNVRDYAPRLETFKPVLNTYQPEYAGLYVETRYTQDVSVANYSCDADVDSGRACWRNLGKYRHEPKV